MSRESSWWENGDLVLHYHRYKTLRITSKSYFFSEEKKSWQMVMLNMIFK